MVARKVTPEQWKYEVQRAMRVREMGRNQLKRYKFMYFENVIRKVMPLPIIIGLIALYLLWHFYGWREFLKFFLSWVVSLTLVATGTYYLWRYFEKQL